MSSFFFLFYAAAARTFRVTPTFIGISMNGPRVSICSFINFVNYPRETSVNSVSRCEVPPSPLPCR